MSENTKGAWHQDQYGNAIDCRGNDIKVNGFALSGSEEAKENTRRILACVNACEGIPTYQLFVENNNPNNLGAVIDALRQKLIEAEKKIQEIEKQGTYFNAP